MPAFIVSRLKGHPLLQRILKNIGWLLIEKILRISASVAVLSYLARYLGPGQFGLLNYATAFVALFSAFASLGLDTIVVRELSRKPEARDVLLGTTCVLKLLGGLVAGVLCLTALAFIRPEQQVMYWLVGIMALGFLFQAFDVIDLWFQSQIQASYSVVARSSAFFLMVFAKMAMIYLGASLMAFAWAMSLELLLVSVGLIAAYLITGKRLTDWIASIEQAIHLLRDSWPLILSGLFVMIYMRIDQVMLAELFGEKEVGIYSVAMRLLEVWYFIPMIVASSTYPSIVSAVSEAEIFYQRLQRLYNVMALLGYAAIITTILMGSWFIVALFGEEYQAAGPMLNILIWSGLFTNLGVARSSFLMAKNWAHLHTLSVFFGCIINIVLNYMLIPSYGGIGAAIATCVSYWFAAHGFCYIYGPLFKTGNMVTRALIFPFGRIRLEHGANG
ncbi:MAG: flippase [Oscillochloridaceae bacterium]|nr:flippase [Oscillochloridaceae bacterium]